MKDFFQGKRVFLTGHTGFKGAWLSYILNILGAEVTGFSLSPPTNPNLFETLELDKKVNHFLGDVRDFNTLSSVIKRCSPQIVFHLAAQSIVKDSYERPYETFDVNFKGTLNLLEALRSCKELKVLIIVTSDKCYKNKEWIYGYREVDELGGLDPYSCSKACVELLCNSYFKNFFQNKGVATARAGNVIGGGDWQRYRLIPDCVKALSSNQVIKIRNPNSIRPWQHVFDALYGYIILAKALWDDPKGFSGAWNFGPLEEDVARVRDVVEKVIDLWGAGSYEEVSSDFKETHLLRLDISKSLFLLNWRPVWRLEKALKKTVEWYKTFYEKRENILELSYLQVLEFFKDAKVW